MSPSMNPGPFELRDATGSTVGVFLPEQQLLDLLAERDALTRQVADLSQQTTALAAQAQEIARQRDEHLRSVQRLTRELLVPITEEELDGLKKNGISFEEVIAEFEQTVASERRGA